MNKNSVCLGHFQKNLRYLPFEKLLNLTSSNSLNESYRVWLSFLGIRNIYPFEASKSRDILLDPFQKKLEESQHAN